MQLPTAERCFVMRKHMSSRDLRLWPSTLYFTRALRMVSTPFKCHSNSEKNEPTRTTRQWKGAKTLAAGLLCTAAAWMPPPVLAMQELASDLGRELDVGMGSVPDTSLVTIATVIYCSLAFLAMFFQSEQEAEGESKPDTQPKRVAPTSHQQPPPASSVAHWPAGAPNSRCPSYHEQRVMQLASNATSSISMTIRDAKYLLQQIVPEHLQAVCDGCPPPSRSNIHLPSSGPLSMRGVEEVEVREWLHGLVEAYLHTKQQATGLARETAARVVLNNQAAAVRDISATVAKEAAMMAAVTIFNTMMLDPAFSPNSPFMAARSSQPGL